MESLKRMVTGQGLEETSGETGDREATLKEAEEREKCVGEKTAERSSSEDRDNDIEMEGEHMVRKRRTLADSCWMGRDYGQEHTCLQRTITRRTRVVQSETS